MPKWLIIALIIAGLLAIMFIFSKDARKGFSEGSNKALELSK